MPTLKVQNGLLKLIEEPDREEGWMWLYRVLITKKKAPQPGEESYQLSAFKSVSLKRGDLTLSLRSLVTDGFSTRHYWVISLVELHQNATQVIASRDEKSMREAFDNIEAAMHPRDRIIDASIKIQNSTVVTGTVSGNVNNKVKVDAEPVKG